MSNVIIHRTHIEITDYKLGDCPRIENIFSIYDMTYRKRYPKGRIYDEQKRSLLIPRGINIGYIERLLQIEPIIDYTMDPVGDIGKIMLKKKPRDEVQKQAISFMLSMDKYHHNETNTMMSVNLGTGKGKTYCAVAVSAFLGMRPIVITDSKEWLRQWKDRFVEYTDIIPEEVYIISGTPSMMKLFNRDINKYKVILSTHSTLKSVGDSQGWDKISEFFKYCQIGLKFYDEAHLNFDNMFQIDCYTNSFITYYLTATPARSDYKEDAIYSMYFKNVPSIDLFDRENDPHTKYAAIKFLSKPTPIQIGKCKNSYGLNRPLYTNYLVHSEEFRKILRILVWQALNKNGKSLFYVGTNEAILYVKRLIYEDFPELINMVGIYTSITPPERKAIELSKKIILSTTKSAGAAMDIDNLAEAVQLAEPFKSRVLAQQTFGRTRNDNTIYKDIVDMSFSQTRKFYEFKKPVFKKYATDCKEVVLSSEDLDRKQEAIMKEHDSLKQPVIFYERNDSNTQK